MSNAEAGPSSKDFIGWSVKIAEYWFELGIVLGVPEVRLTNIDINTQLYHTHEKRAFQMLKTWKEQGGASYRKMADALRRLGKVELAKSISLPVEDDSHTGARNDSGPPNPSNTGSTVETAEKPKNESSADRHDGEPTDLDLLLVQSVGNKYEELGMYLGVPTDVLQEIKDNTNLQTPGKKALAMLKEWRNRDEAPSCMKLAEGLRIVNVGRGDLAKKLLKQNPGKGRCGNVQDLGPLNPTNTDTSSPHSGPPNPTNTAEQMPRKWQKLETDVQENVVFADSRPPNPIREATPPIGDKLSVLCLAEHWGESPKDELSMINRELAKYLKEVPQVGEVTVFVPPGQNTEAKEDARKCGVRLLEAKKSPGTPRLQLLSRPPENLKVDVVIGYGSSLGPQALLIKETKNCKWVQFVYVSNEDLSMHKDCREYQNKHKVEVELCERADLVVPVGPKLADIYSRKLSYSRTNIGELTPGIFRELCEVSRAADDQQDKGQFRILAFGRGYTIDDFKLKGYDIAAEAVAGLSQRKYGKLCYVGTTDGKEEEIKDIFLKQDIINRNRLMIRSLPKNRDELLTMFSEFDLCIMPSRTEGFGLSALEALSAGVPILVTGNSGFGQALEKVQFGNTFIVRSEDPKAWREKIEEILVEKARPNRLEEARSIRDAYDKMYPWHRQCITLVQSIYKLLQENPGEGSGENVQGYPHAMRWPQQLCMRIPAGRPQPPAQPAEAAPGMTGHSRECPVCRAPFPPNVDITPFQEHVNSHFGD